ncbi:MAG: NUDIX hydrolase [Holophagales bacterium]|nr:NUDIX hydrolase [Holophagales bacterium]
MRTWTRVGAETLFRHRLFELRRESLSAGGEERRESMVLDAPAWVNIVALDAGRRVLLVRQWRFGIAAPTVEIPGGMVDPGESAREAAERELLEETGYRARRWSELGAVEPNPAFLTNRCTTFLAEELERMGEPTGDGEEEIEVEWGDLDAIGARVLSGEIRHALVVAAFYLFAQRAATAR